jgi:catechol 2,3-dioxygenase-like lactoylglutathione lyase family enzyme
MKIKLDHINLTVRDLAESIEWYSKIFGFKLVEQGIGSRGQSWAIVACNDSMIVMSEYKNKQSAEEAPETAFHKIYHFGIRVSDLMSWENVVKEFRLKLFYGGVIEYPFSKSWYIHDPSGHEIEISHTNEAELRFP